jgi:hypothetical protein
MTKKIFYEKVGRRYIPVSEYNNEWMDSYPKGAHLTICVPGGKSRRFNIDPNYAALIAASHVAEDVLAKALVKAGELRLQRPDRERKMTPSQKAAWENLVKEFGNSARQLEWPSAREVAEEGMKALQQEANELLSNEIVRKAYDHFILVCKLIKDHSVDKQS